MRVLLLGIVLVLGLAATIVSCSGGGATAGGADAAADAHGGGSSGAGSSGVSSSGTQSTPCSPLAGGRTSSFPVHGAVSATVTSTKCSGGCAWGNASAFCTSNDDGGHTDYEVAVSVDPAPRKEQTGTVTSDVTFGSFRAPDGAPYWPVHSWSTSDGGCSLTITSSACSSFDAGLGSNTGDTIQATGHCSRPAEPDLDSGAAGEVDIDDFSVFFWEPYECLN
jgi:hypothetical protein